MKTSEKVMWSGIVILAGLAVATALVAPTIVREARRIVAPIQRMKGRQRALENVVATSAWKRPDTDAIGAEQLDRFFTVRRRIEEVHGRSPAQLERLPRRRVRSLEDLKHVPDAIEAVTDVVGAQMDALVEARMSPDEYRWLERVVYERWRGPLRKAGTYPVSARAAAAEIETAAAQEPDARVRSRLRAVAEALRRRQPAPPAGFDAQTHALLLAHLDDVERWSMDDRTPTIPIR